MQGLWSRYWPHLAHFAHLAVPDEEEDEDWDTIRMLTKAATSPTPDYRAKVPGARERTRPAARLAPATMPCVTTVQCICCAACCCMQVEWMQSQGYTLPEDWPFDFPVGQVRTAV